MRNGTISPTPRACHTPSDTLTSQAHSRIIYVSKAGTQAHIRVVILMESKTAVRAASAPRNSGNHLILLHRTSRDDPALQRSHDARGTRSLDVTKASAIKAIESPENSM